LIVCFLAVFACVGAARLTNIKLDKLPPKPKVDLCPYCVDFFDQALDDLLQILLNGGVIGSCNDLCGQLTNQYEQIACDLLCDYVGIEAFIDAIQYEDPDPIYLCQLVDICGHVDGGAANITQVIINPSTINPGDTIQLGFQYKVTAPTGPGTLVVSVNPPDGGFEVDGGEFTEGLAVGVYTVGWQLDTTTTQDDPFSPGVYQVQFFVCEGDCTTSHPYGGVYTSVNATFTIAG